MEELGIAKCMQLEQRELQPVRRVSQFDSACLNLVPWAFQNPLLRRWAHMTFIEP